MAEDPTAQTPTPVPAATPAPGSPALGSAAYEIIRQRLDAQGATLRERVDQLNDRRREVFGAIEYQLLQADRIVTTHNCAPRDMVQLGQGRFLFGFNVQFGLKRDIDLDDVFAVYERDETAGTFKEGSLDPLRDPAFLTDFKRLYQVYEKTVFSKFSVIGPHLFLVFRTGSGPNDIAVLKWTCPDDQWRYLDGRAESEYRRVAFPPQHEFRWLKPDRESYRYGDHPHVSIEDRVFVECIGGDLTIKIEDNTASGEGVYAEPVEDRHQKVDDAEIHYALLGPLILLRIRPYKESNARFILFHQKLQTAVRVDSLGESCALLPEDHGLIFPNGYYLNTGELKLFEGREPGLTLERVVHAPSGEDSLFVFYSPVSGEYVLMPYRLILQRVDERITCHGFSLFPNGHLVHFRSDPEPTKHHLIQLRQTPFHQPGHEPPGRRDAFLYHVGNKEVVRCLADCHEILTLLRKHDPYAELYTDMVRRCGAVLDAYPWLSSPDGFQIHAALRQVQEAADRAVGEFDNVRRLQREAARRLTQARTQIHHLFQTIRRANFSQLEDYVHHLNQLRQSRGELIALKEVRYLDVAQLEPLEQEVASQSTQLAGACVQFLLKPQALDPYRQRAATQLAAVEQVQRAAEGRKLDESVTAAARELELLIETVNSLRIDDATESTRIIDAITGIYATLNQVRAALHQQLQSLQTSEAAAQFAAQLKLLSQSAASYLDLCHTPARCEEFLNRITLQIEELEGTFADFEDYTVQLAERRNQLYEAFEQRKVALIEQRNRRALALLAAGERTLKVIANRLATFSSLEEIHAYIASDRMVAKVRDTIQQLIALEDSVKADDLQGRLNSAQQEAVRQLKDRQELFTAGPGVIRLGQHHFHTHSQPLDLTIVLRHNLPNLHLTSTQFFDPITDPQFLETRAAWSQEVLSETPEVYRAEYLACRYLESVSTDPSAKLKPLAGLPHDALLQQVQEFIAPRYLEGYARGIHDLDATAILQALLPTHLALDLARFHPDARACALVYWHRFCPPPVRSRWEAQLHGFAARNQLFPGDPTHQPYIRSLQSLLSTFTSESGLYAETVAQPAGEYLFHQLTQRRPFVVTREAHEALAAFRQHLVSKGSEDTFQEARSPLATHPESELNLVRDWVRGFLLDRPQSTRHLEEIAALLFCGDTVPTTVIDVPMSRTLDGLRGSHPRIQNGRYQFDYLDLHERLHHFTREIVPRFEAYLRVKQMLIDRERRRLRLDEFQPRVLTSFVRNQLIDDVYLPLIGDNLAKQIGAAGDRKRTDLMGLLLLISPPGYGKTTLVEYLASRLGLIFVKINGPALGHATTSLDPEDAPNAAAREEIQKLNLALEMGDNVMLCIDDIQHCHTEFLQKFISLCDAQRKIEGVWRQQSRTYDLRGRKVVVVMAGNPYTESGQKFKLPDMLANRADTYNLGDIIGRHAQAFQASYLENAITSNPVLALLANKSQKDVRAFIRIAEGGNREAESFEASYSAHEIDEILNVLKKLTAIRNAVLRVNQEYIHSAAQADDYRTEPPFKLQGSYRNMNRLAEKVVPIMNDPEVQALLLDHYKNESQTLTTDTEANLLKLKEILGALTPDDQTRWDEIKKTFRRNQLVRTADPSDPVGRVVGQLSAFHAGLQSIQETLATQLARPTPTPAPTLHINLDPLRLSLDSLRNTVEENLARSLALASTPVPAPATPPPPSPPADPELATRLAQGLENLRLDLSRAITAVHSGTMADRVASLSHELEMIHSTLATLKDVAGQQRDHLRAAQELLAARVRQGTVEFELTEEMLTNERQFLDRFHQILANAQRPPQPPPPLPEQPNPPP
jgi:hypothetical protein